MKIKDFDSWGPNPQPEEIPDYVQAVFDDNSFSEGYVEAAQSTADNAVKALGRLLDVLASKGLLTAPEVAEIVRGYARPDAEFEEDAAQQRQIAEGLLAQVVGKLPKETL